MKHGDFVAAWQALAPGHDSRPLIELGYSRNVCSACGTNWPCPSVAQAMAAVVEPDAEKVARDLEQERVQTHTEANGASA